jgi:hypothetical protein
VILAKSQFYFQGESDDCINRLAKKDGLLAKYVSLCESVIQFNSLLFLCRVNSHKASYRHSTVITLSAIQHKDNSYIIVIIIIK